MKRSAIARLEVLEAAAPAGSSAWPPEVQAWYTAHGWLPAGFCACLALAALRPADLPAPCGVCPQVVDPRHAPAARALPIVSVAIEEEEDIPAS